MDQALPEPNPVAVCILGMTRALPILILGKTRALPIPVDMETSLLKYLNTLILSSVFRMVLLGFSGVTTPVDCIR